MADQCLQQDQPWSLRIKPLIDAIATWRIAARAEIIEHIFQLRVINRPGIPVRDKILLADIGGVVTVVIFRQKVIKRLFTRRADLCWNRFIPFFGVGKLGINVKNNTAERKMAVTNNITNVENRFFFYFFGFSDIKVSFRSKGV